MKKMINYACSMLMATAILAAMVFVSCKKDKEDPSGGNPEVLTEANNSKALGKYSGILLGSSGYYTIEVRTTGSTATVVFDGKTYALEGQGSINDGDAITNYMLQKGDIKIIFSVKADGKSPAVKIDIPGHKVQATIDKETTKYETRSYIGKIRDTDANRDIDPVAMTISNGSINGYMKVDTQYVSISGQRIDSSSSLGIIFSNQPNKTYNAGLSNNKITGGTKYVFDLSKVN
ncbi:MAG: hypothetical protein KF862_26795 [Chitinophagaceae bacterium]|nr:hypothetical protein [Chitinophagaceae bacterium]